MSLVLSPEDALQFIACHRVTFPFTPVLYFPIYNAEEKLLWEVNQNFLGVSEQKKNSEISVEGLCFDSSKYWIWELGAKTDLFERGGSQGRS